MNLSRYTLANMLRAAGDQYEQDAKAWKDDAEHVRTHDAFASQAKEARNLAERIEGGEPINLTE